jgi:hypothetical protein
MSAHASQSHLSASPLWGGVRGGGTPDICRSGVPPSLILPHKGGGETARCAETY